MLTRDEAIIAYRLILGREPQDEGIIQWHIREHPSLAELRSFLLASDEFRRGLDGVGWLGPLMAFEVSYGRKPDPAEIAIMEHYIAALKVITPTEMLRAAVMAFSRADHPTPVAIRFVDHQLATVTIQQTDQRLVLDRFDWSVANTIIGTKNYEPHLRRFIEAVVKPGMVCIDIGANVGFHTFVMRSLVGDEGHIYAVEPNSENCRMLMLSALENDAKNLTIIPVALSNNLGAIAFSPAIGSNGGFMYVAGDPLNHPNCSIVPTVRLDDLLTPNRLDFIKIDVEGAEFLALDGAKNLIRKHRPVITSEFSSDMLEGISGITGEDYINIRMADGYRAYTLNCSGPYEEILSPSQFMSAWVDRFRIEDLAFVPIEHPFNFREFREMRQLEGDQILA